MILLWSEGEERGRYIIIIIIIIVIIIVIIIAVIIIAVIIYCGVQKKVHSQAEESNVMKNEPASF